MGPKPACFGAFSTTFRFPKSELPSTHGHIMPKIMYILENLNQISGKLEIHTKTQKCTYFGENIYFLQGKKICVSFPKNIRKREKIGDLTMKANFI